MKTRLTKYLRCQLNSLMKREIQRWELEATVKEAYGVIATNVRALVELKYPPAEMAVLKKYDCHHIDDCVKLHLADGTVDQFRFLPGTGPLVPNRFTCQQRIYDLGPPDQAAMLTEQFNRWKSASDTFREGNRVLWTDYAALINNARHLEDLAEVWPASATLLKREPSTAVSIVTPELMERIRRDQEARQAAAPVTGIGFE